MVIQFLGKSVSLLRNLQILIKLFHIYTAALNDICFAGQSNYFWCSDYPTGINFDFNKLQASEGHYYNVTTQDYDYLLNLCGPVKNTLCDQKTGHVTNPGVCQIKHGGTAV